MSRTTRTATALGLAFGVLVMTACGPDDPTSSSTGSTSTLSSSATSTPAPATSSATTSLSPEAAAGQAVVAFWTKLDELASNPTQPLSDLAAVARDQALSQWQRNITEMRGLELKQVGSVVLGQPEVVPDASPTAYNVKVCVDVSKVNVVDKDGKSAVSPTRLPRANYTYSVQKGNDGRFYVSTDTMQGQPC